MPEARPGSPASCRIGGSRVRLPSTPVTVGVVIWSCTWRHGGTPVSVSTAAR
ncbi:hypothetical protein [Amycolatopsis sp.]|uniref:hypothetical protein n=1 Tax=Amycolatopsis sp. TaxID=37632 RepID=UPI002D08173D|nr:hypothetical protein [Amycolatopsis sp.]HVV14099.1 hypothetical protein [Amycolatopsis sp.]